MAAIKRTLVAVSFVKRHWVAILSILESDCRRKGKDWIVWGNQVKTKIQNEMNNITSPDELICVTLPEESWNAIISFIKSNCASRRKEWITWGDNIVQKIRGTIEAMKNQPETNQISQK